MADTSDLGHRLKGYEKKDQLILDPTLPIVIRLDGNSFSKFTKNFKKPFDPLITESMEAAAKKLFDRISHTKFSYTQSDEITLIVAPSDQGIVGNRVDKICSILASCCSNAFNQKLNSLGTSDILAEFDCRAFNVPSLDEARNALLWRQFDCWKNFIGIIAHTKFGSKKLHKVNTHQKITMLEDIGVDVNKDFHKKFHHGATFYKEKKLMPIPEEYKQFPQNKGKTHIHRNVITLSTGLISGDLFTKVMNDE